MSLSPQEKLEALKRIGKMPEDNIGGTKFIFFEPEMMRWNKYSPVPHKQSSNGEKENES